MHPFSDKTVKWPFQQTTIWGIRFHNKCLSPAGVTGGSTVAAAAKSTRRICFPPPRRIQPLGQPCWALRQHVLSVAQIKQFSPPVLCSRCPAGSFPHPRKIFFRLELRLQKLHSLFSQSLYTALGETRVSPAAWQWISEEPGKLAASLNTFHQNMSCFDKDWQIQMKICPPSQPFPESKRQKWHSPMQLFFLHISNPVTKPEGLTDIFNTSTDNSSN